MTNWILLLFLTLGCSSLELQAPDPDSDRDPNPVVTPLPAMDLAPLAPESLSATPLNPTQISLQWADAFDDFGIADYIVYRNGIEVARTSGANTHLDISLNPGSMYDYAVQSVDTADQKSELSLHQTAQTPMSDVMPPLLSNGRPNSSLPSGTQSVLMQVNTNEPATCKYGVLPNESYGSMAAQFTATGGTLHSVSLSNLVDGRSYVYYIRCRDGANNANPPSPAFSVVFSVTYAVAPDDSSAWTVMDNQCRWCHTASHPTGGFDLSAHMVNANLITGMQDGIPQEMAPLMKRLSTVDKNTLLDFIVRHGGNVPAQNIPATFTWDLNTDVLNALPDGTKISDGATSSNPTKKAAAFGWVHEDTFIDHDAWSVKTITKNGITRKCVGLDQHRVTPDNPSGSHNPSSYLVFKGLPYHGRFKNSRMEGDVLFGRWMSMGMHAVDMKPPLRADRQYVRLQFDRDAIDLRSFPKAGQNETAPWCTGSAICSPCADGRLVGNTHKCQYLSTSWRHFVLEARTQPNGDVLWTAVVNAYNSNGSIGAQIANLSAIEPASSIPFKGVFFLHAYSTNDDPDRCWANLHYTADVDQN